MDIDALKKSISEASDEELMEIIKESRNSRRTPTKSTAKKKKKSKIEAAVDPKVLLKTLTPEQRKALIEELGG